MELVEDVVVVSDVVVEIATKINCYCSDRRTKVRNSIRSATQSNIRQAQYQFGLYFSVIEDEFQRKRE